jgi:hypothetical protein
VPQPEELNAHLVGLMPAFQQRGEKQCGKTPIYWRNSAPKAGFSRFALDKVRNIKNVLNVVSARSPGSTASLW